MRADQGPVTRKARHTGSLPDNARVTDDEVREGSMQVPDGRTVAWTDWGDGTPVLRMPGTPGSRWSIRADREPWRERGLRMITTERPGFGASTRLPGRGFAEHADDVAAILDHLGIDRVHVYGGSGGSPHILSFCSRHPDRVKAATILVGAAPMNEDEVDQMIGLNVQAHKLARAGDLDGLRELMTPYHAAMSEDPLASLRGIMAEAPEEDQRVMNDPGWQRGMEKATKEAMRPGLEGWMDEGLAISLPWDDIDMSGVTTSLTWWHAPGDRNCPISAAQRLVDSLPDARLNVWEGGGHLTTYLREPEVLDELLSRG
jgi:pimeloyl-ACP methyl ester carboxylesterase